MKIGNKILFSYLLILVIYIGFSVFREFRLSLSNERFARILPINNQNLILQEQIYSINALESEINSYLSIGSEELKNAIVNYPATSSQQIFTLNLEEAKKKEFSHAFQELSENITMLIKVNGQPENKYNLNNQIMKIYESIDKLKALEKGLLDSKIYELKQIIKDQEQITSQISRAFLISGIFILIFGTIFSFLISRSITQPIINLRDSAIKIGKGNLDTNIAVKGNDEIGELAKSISQMKNDLKESRSKLEEYNKTLEQKVEERTKELDDKMKELEKINGFMVDRELKMVELKAELERLKKST